MTTAKKEHPFVGKYIRPEVLPHKMCPGCGNMIAGNALIRAVDRLYGSFDKFVFVSGIGCAAWVPSPHFNADTVHTLHGRAIPAAIGIKLANPSLNVIVFSGDGDLIGIGGNHIIHAARRNIDLLVMMINNFNYGMTGGQLAPTTPLGAKTITTIYGNPESPFDVARLIAEAGANYSARWTVYHNALIEKSVEKALKMEGFRFIEVLSPCVTRYVKFNIGSLEKIMDLFKKQTVIYKGENQEIPPGKIVIGEFVIRENPGYLRRYGMMREKAIKQWRKS